MAKLEWAANGGLGRIIIGKVRFPGLSASSNAHANHPIIQNTLPMADLVRPDPHIYVSWSLERVFRHITIY